MTEASAYGTESVPACAPPERVDGYAPLGSYAGLGDGRSVALLALDGGVDWWALPDLHSEPTFSALLDPAGGGRFTLAPTEDYTVERRYVGLTNVVETTFTTASGTVRLTDSLNTGVAGRLPWSELARRVEGLSGSVPMRWAVEPGSALGTLSPWARATDAGPLLMLDDLTIGVRCGGVGEPLVGDRGAAAEFTTHEGSRGLLALVATGGEPLYLPPVADIDARIDRTVQGWRDWSEQLRWPGPYEQAVRRSALALKLLLHAPTGSVAAAATTSLPERIGGDKNWDYRYTWVRDTAFTLDAFVRCGLHEEVHAAVSWLLATVQRHGPRLWPFYAIDGSLPERREVRDVPGYRGSRPVVDGNAAATQLQLGPYGDLFQTVLLCVGQGYQLDLDTQRMLSDLADRCCDDWQRRDAGLWELPEEEHYTISKMACWQALDRAAKLAECGQLPGDGSRWAREALRVRAWVEEHCWSARLSAYTMCAGSERLDAAVLLGGRIGFDRDGRMRSTVRAVQGELGSPLVHRYTGMAQQEGAFLACSFWLVEALAFTGARADAAAVMDEVLGRLGGALLLAEMVDPASGELLGNLPQALSHLALINAASALHETS